MKFGKNLSLVVEISDPEWAPFWMNYKYLKKKINDIVVAQGGVKVDQQVASKANEIAKSQCEREFFQSLKYELKKASDFFAQSEQLYKIREHRVQEGYRMLKEGLQANKTVDKSIWKMLLSACMKLYRDVLLLENFAIMNYCGFSKILKKHDKLTGYSTRDAFMRNVMSRQNFTQYTYVMECIKKSEILFADIQAMESTVGLHDEEKLFIEALRGLNYQASKLQEEEKDTTVESQQGLSETEYKTTESLPQNSNAITPQVIGISTTKRNPLTKSSMLFPAGEVTASQDLRVHEVSDANKHDVMSNLDQAASVAVRAASRVSNFSCSPNIQVALSWMEAIRRKDPKDNTVPSPESISNTNVKENAAQMTGGVTDTEEAEVIAVGKKRLFASIAEGSTEGPLLQKSYSSMSRIEIS